MRVLMVSKALVSASYRQKLSELARLGVEVVALVPNEWREAGGTQRLEHQNSDDYQLIATHVRWNGRFHLHYYPVLPRLVQQVRPEILHIDEEPYNLATYLAARSAWSTRTPSLFFTWQNLLRRYPLPFRKMERWVYNHASYALAGSREAGEVLRTKGFQGPLSIIPQFGVDAGMFFPGTPPERIFNVGFLNRLVVGKGPLVALDAFARLPQDSHLTVVGDGPMREQMETRVHLSGLQRRVTIRARMPSTEIPTMLRNLHAVVLPSISTPTWKEQFGRILIEAMASGVPVVGSNSGEIPNVVGDAGLIVPEGDVGALAGALQRLYDDQQLRSELGVRGRQRVLERFTHARIAEHTVRAYDEMVRVAPG